MRVFLKFSRWSRFFVHFFAFFTDKEKYFREYFWNTYIDLIEFYLEGMWTELEYTRVRVRSRKGRILVQDILYTCLFLILEKISVMFTIANKVHFFCTHVNTMITLFFRAYTHFSKTLSAGMVSSKDIYTWFYYLDVVCSSDDIYTFQFHLCLYMNLYKDK